MGLFDRYNDEFYNMVTRAKLNSDYFASELESIDINAYKEKFNDDKLFGSILIDISRYGWELQKTLNNLLIVYNDIVKEGTKDEKLLFKRIYQFLNDNVISEDWDITYYMELSRAFDNKDLVL